MLNKLARELCNTDFAIIESRNFPGETSERFVQTDLHLHQEIVT